MGERELALGSSLVLPSVLGTPGFVSPSHACQSTWVEHLPCLPPFRPHSFSRHILGAASPGQFQPCPTPAPTPKQECISTAL